MTGHRPTILIFDSGVGGLTVLRPIRAARPDARYVYIGDTAFFPYGERDEAELITRVVTVINDAVRRFNPDLVVIACHTASTLVLPSLRAQLTIPVVGTVPAIKPAAETSQSRFISVLATKGTVRRDYTSALIRDFAGDCDVTLVSAPHLAAYAEDALHGKPVSDDALLAEIAPAFIEKDEGRTDRVVLACTHYPLLLPALERVAPWPGRHALKSGQKEGIMRAGEHDPIRPPFVFFDESRCDFGEQGVIGDRLPVKRVFRISGKMRRADKRHVAIAGKIADQRAGIVAPHCAFGREHGDETALRCLGGRLDGGHGAHNRNRQLRA